MPFGLPTSQYLTNLMAARNEDAENEVVETETTDTMDIDTDSSSEYSDEEPLTKKPQKVREGERSVSQQPPDSSKYDSVPQWVKDELLEPQHKTADDDSDDEWEDISPKAIRTSRALSEPAQRNDSAAEMDMNHLRDAAALPDGKSLRDNWMASLRDIVEEKRTRLSSSQDENTASTKDEKRHRQEIEQHESDTKKAKKMKDGPLLFRLDVLPGTSPERQIAYERLAVTLTLRWARDQTLDIPTSIPNLVKELAAEVKYDCERCIPHFTAGNIFGARSAKLVPWRRRVVVLFENEWMDWFEGEARRGEGVSEGIGERGECFGESMYETWSSVYGKPWGH